jgi:hypothetical protein
VARSLRLAQSVHRLDAIDAAPPGTLKTLWQASRIASTIAALLAHPHHVHTRPPPPDTPRLEAPVPPRRLALPLAVSGQSSAQAFALQGAEATPRWNTIAEWLTHSGRAPHGRRRPSVLDQLRGWKRPPMARQETSCEDASHDQVKAAA